MERRRITQALLAGGVGMSLGATQTEARSGTAPSYAQTPAEGAVGVIPERPQFPPLNVLRYGAEANALDSADRNTSAIQNALYVAIAGGGGTVILPPGNYYTRETLLVRDVVPISGPGKGTALLADGVTIQGSGQDATTITMTSAVQSGIQIGIAAAVAICTNCFVRDLTLQGHVAMSGGAAIGIMNAGNCGISNVRFGGNGRNLNLAIDLDTVQGATPQMQGGYSYYVSNCEINACTSGIALGRTYFVEDVFLTGIVIDGAVGEGVDLVSASGVYLSQVATNSCGTGIRTSPPAGMNVNAVFCAQVLSDSTDGNCWNICTRGGQVVEFVMTDCWGSGAGNTPGGSSSAAGVLISQGTGTINGVKISGGIFHHNFAAGISVRGAANVVIRDAQVYQNSFAGEGQHSGIEIGAGVSDFVIANNICGSGGYFGVINALPNNQAFGILVEEGASNNYVITGNLVTGNVNASAISDGGAGPTKCVRDNAGYNPLPQTPIKVGLSPFVHSNNTGAPVIVYVQGGAVTSVKTATGLVLSSSTNAAVTVPPGAAIVVTYSVLPTMAYAGT